MTTDAAALPPTAGPELTGLARYAIGRQLGVAGDGPGPAALKGAEPWLVRDGASFVTLTQGGALRGCIGTLEAWRPLADDVASNAVSAAVRDPRFAPLLPGELPHTDIEVSVLSPARPLEFADKAEALAKLRPGRDGVILAAAGRRATFLPQVWDDLPDAATFLGHLLRKAGLPADSWPEDLRLYRYDVAAFHEERVAP